MTDKLNKGSNALFVYTTSHPTYKPDHVNHTLLNRMGGGWRGGGRVGSTSLCDFSGTMYRFACMYFKYCAAMDVHSKLWEYSKL